MTVWDAGPTPSGVCNHCYAPATDNQENLNISGVGPDNNSDRNQFFRERGSRIRESSQSFPIFPVFPRLERGEIILRYSGAHLVHTRPNPLCATGQ